MFIIFNGTLILNFRKIVKSKENFDLKSKGVYFYKHYNFCNYFNTMIFTILDYLLYTLLYCFFDENVKLYYQMKIYLFIIIKI